MKLVNHKYDGEISPVYFSLAMKRSYNIFIIYFGIFILCMAAFGYPANCIPVFFLAHRNTCGQITGLTISGYDGISCFM